MPDAEQIEIRLLRRDDGPEYQTLRLESLQMNPEAFLSTYEAEVTLHEDAFADHLDWSYHPPVFGYHGFFLDGKLIGYVQLNNNYLEKQKHIMSLNNLYISAAQRKHGFATQLVNHVLVQAQQHEQIERVFLSCTGQNSSAYRLYKRLGFRRYSVKVKAIKWNDIYDDEIEMVLNLGDKAFLKTSSLTTVTEV